MSNEQRREAFIHWVQAFDDRFLEEQNENEVELKVVLPLLRHLGYPDSCMRSEHSPRGYYPGRRSGNPRIDKAYFSVDDPARQGPDTSLVIVEAKAPDKD